jgi:hypothetical protein
LIDVALGGTLTATWELVPGRGFVRDGVAIHPDHGRDGIAERLAAMGYRRESTSYADLYRLPGDSTTMRVNHHGGDPQLVIVFKDSLTYDGVELLATTGKEVQDSLDAHPVAGAPYDGPANHPGFQDLLFFVDGSWYPQLEIVIATSEDMGGDGDEVTHVGLVSMAYFSDPTNHRR